MNDPKLPSCVEPWWREMSDAAERKDARAGLDALSAAIAAAEERGRRSGVEEAAKVCDVEREAAWKSSRGADARGNHRVGAADAHVAATAQRLAEAIRALAPRDSAPELGHCGDPAHDCSDGVCGARPAPRDSAPDAEMGLSQDELDAIEADAYVRDMGDRE